jgi:hypothetical protein
LRLHGLMPESRRAVVEQAREHSVSIQPFVSLLTCVRSGSNPRRSTPCALPRLSEQIQVVVDAVDRLEK